MKWIRVLVTLIATGLMAAVSMPSHADDALARVTEAPCLNVREGPSAASEQLTCIPRNTLVTVICTDDGWVRVSYAEHVGFVAFAGIALNASSSSPPFCASNPDGAESVPDEISFPPLVVEPPRPPQPDRRRPPEVLTRFQAAMAGCAMLGWQLCTSLGLHYLEGSGDDYFVDIDDVVDGEPLLQDKYAQLLSDELSRALTAVAVHGAPQAFDSGWRMVASPSNGDARFALGTFSIRLVGDVRLGPARSDGTRPAEVRYRLFLVDVYDFAPCRGGDPFCVYRSLADLGQAAEFLVYGASETFSSESTLEELASSPPQIEW